MSAEQTPLFTNDKTRFVIGALLSLLCGAIGALLHWDSQLFITSAAFCMMGFWLCDIFADWIPASIHTVRFPMLRAIFCSLAATILFDYIYDVYPFVQSACFLGIGIDVRLTYISLAKREQA